MSIKDFFVVHAGKYGSLPKSELVGSLEATEANFSLKPGTKYLSRFTCELSKAKESIKRVALSHFLCEELIFQRGSISNLFNLLNKLDLAEGGSFYVRVNRVEGSIPAEEVSALEREVGSILSEKFKKKTSFKNPEEIFILHVEDNAYALGKFLEPSERKKLKERQNKTKPKFHASMLPPDLSRALVNLARVKKGDIFLDPFCGMGGVLLEAELIGARAIGVDFKEKMLRGAKENLTFYGAMNYDLIKGDARFLPVAKSDKVATDPPYGRLSPKLKKEPIVNLYTKFIANLSNIIATGGHFAMVYPKGLEVKTLLNENGFQVISEDDVIAHQKLTRVFLASRKVG
ncbi:MAG: DNA methyltransferase [Thermoproteota archaeon]